MGEGQKMLTSHIRIIFSKITHTYHIYTRMHTLKLDFSFIRRNFNFSQIQNIIFKEIISLLYN